MVLQKGLGIWSAEKPGCVHEIALVLHGDMPDFVEHMKLGLVPAPKDLYEVVPNGAGYEPLLRECLRYRLDKKMFFESQEETWRKIFFIWKCLVDRLKAFDIRGAEACVCILLESYSGDMARFGRVLESVSEFLDACLKPLIDSCIFRTYHADGEWLWWDLPVACISGIERFSNRLDRAVQDGFPNLKHLADFSRTLLGEFKGLAGRQVSDKFYELSAFCIALAKKKICNGDVQGGYLLVYRSLDLFFQSFGLRAGALLETKAGVRYRSSLDQRVYLKDTEYILVQEQKLISDHARAEWVRRINQVRNQMLATHGAHSVSRIEAERCISEAEALVRRIEGSTKWEARANRYFPVELDISPVIFDALPDIDTYIPNRNELLS